MNFREQYENYRRFFEETLSDFCGGMNFFPPVLGESMRYSLSSGGKRLRPVLFSAALDLLGADYKKEGALAVAIECIHTYSLIHDDLPAMDDDDFRRGNPSNHKVFGEANAILAGDALLTYAFEIVLHEVGRGEAYRRAGEELARAAGPSGMVAGQSADLFYSANGAGERELSYIHRNKTAKLIAAPLVMAAMLAGRAEEEMRTFGEALGMLFQLTDDILDGTDGESETEKQKLTAVHVFGLRGAEDRAKACAEACTKALHTVDGDREFFESLVEFIRSRDH